MMGTMKNRRLLLTDRGDRTWRLDDETRRRGKEGVARARAELERAIAAAEHPEAA
jgi:hypothetical protein